jgi:hypothetical protein
MLQCCFQHECCGHPACKLASWLARRAWHMVHVTVVTHTQHLTGMPFARCSETNTFLGLRCVLCNLYATSISSSSAFCWQHLQFCCVHLGLSAAATVCLAQYDWQFPFHCTISGRGSALSLGHECVHTTLIFDTRSGPCLACLRDSVPQSNALRL